MVESLMNKGYAAMGEGDTDLVILFSMKKNRSGTVYIYTCI